MTRVISIAACVVFVLGLASVAIAAKDTKSSAARDYRGYHFAQDGAQNVLASASTSGVRFKAGAFSDTFCIYGRGQLNLCGSEGRFDDGTGFVPQVLNHSQGCDELNGV